MRTWGGPAALLLALLLSSSAFGQPSMKEGVGIDPRMGEMLPRDVRLRNEEGEIVALGDYFGSQPVILMPVYYRCPMLCGLELNGLVRCLRTMELEPGRDFQIVTFSIDHRETPKLAADKKRSYLKQYGRPEAERGWHFLTGERQAVERLCDAVGFRTVYDKETGQYAHAAAMMICTPEGRIARYLYGVEFAPRDMRLAILEASQNEIASVTDQVLLYCYMYDPTTGKYGLAILRLIRAAGVLTVLLMAAGIGWMLRKERKEVSASQLEDILGHG